MSNQKIRVLVAKPGLDGHDRTAKVIARAPRNAGMAVRAYATLGEICSALRDVYGIYEEPAV